MKKIFAWLLVIFLGVLNVNIALAASSASGDGWNLDDLSEFNLPDSSILEIVTNLLNWILSILGIAGVIGFALAGTMYLLSAGNSTMTDNAKKAMLASILGVIIGLSGLVIIQAVNMALGGSNPRF